MHIKRLSLIGGVLVALILIIWGFPHFFPMSSKINPIPIIEDISTSTIKTDSIPEELFPITIYEVENSVISSPNFGRVSLISQYEKQPLESPRPRLKEVNIVWQYGSNKVSKSIFSLIQVAENRDAFQAELAVDNTRLVTSTSHLQTVDVLLSESEWGSRAYYEVESQLLGFSSTGLLYGSISITAVAGDPPLPQGTIIFVYDHKTQEFISHRIPATDIGAVADLVNIEKGIVFFRDETGNYKTNDRVLHLKLYDLFENSSTTIASFHEAEVFKPTVSYDWCHGWFAMACVAGLRAKWLDSTNFTYFDIIQKQWVTKSISEFGS